MKSVTLYVWCAILVCAVTGTATAQDRRYVRISGNVGFQEGSGRLALDRPLTFFGKSGFFRIDDELATSLIFDGSATVRVWKDLALGAGLAKTRTERLGHPYTASVPSPVP